jgi:hypothetical protein
MISATASEKREVLQAITFGKPTAEEEGKDLSAYFVETDQWHKIFAGDIDVVYGPKGAGRARSTRFCLVGHPSFSTAE